MMKRHLRPMLKHFIRPGSICAHWYFGRRVKSYTAIQASMVKQYAIEPNTPIRHYDNRIENRVKSFADTQTNIFYARTSGTTGKPKSIAYTPKRLKRYKRDSALAAMTTFHHYGVKRSDLFVFASLKQDDSFSSLILNGFEDTPGYLKSVCYPSAHLRDPILRPLFKRYGALSVRLWAIALSNPGVFYSTNPSTIAVFLQNVSSKWPEAVSLLRDWKNGKATTPELETWAHRAGYWISDERLTNIIQCNDMPSFEIIAPSLQAVATWDGGNVSIYINRIHRYLSPEHYQYIPMFSMSTETVQTLPYVVQDQIGFLPIASHVRYEFLPISSEDSPENLIEATDLCVGEEYTMVVSDPYGLLRYHTEDVFSVHQVICGLPDLRFKRRKGLKWSFTGEKITGKQVVEAWSRTIKDNPDLHQMSMALCPTTGSDKKLPGYIILATTPTMSNIKSDHLQNVARQFEKHLRSLNLEFLEKQTSKRLATTEIKLYRYEDLAAALDRRTITLQDKKEESWSSQFKLPPLLQTTYENISWLTIEQ